MTIPSIRALTLVAFIALIYIPSINGRPIPTDRLSSQEGSNDTLIRYDQHFKIDSARVLATPYLKAFSEEVDSIMRIDTINHVRITGVASIDGPVKLNQRLSRARAAAMLHWLEQTTTVPDSIISTDARGEDWGWFKKLVENDTCIPAQKKIIDILNSPVSDTEKESRIRKLDDGNSWKYLAKNVFPIMRCAEVTLGVKHRFIVPVPEESVVVKNNEKDIPVEEFIYDEEVVEEVPVPEYVDEWRRRFYLKTDLPYWLMTWSNLAFEVDIAPHWSFNLPIYFSTVNYFKHTIKFRTFSFQPGFRYWFKGDNTGAYLEAHYGMGWWNFAFDGKYRYQDHFRKTPTIGGGVAAGYRMPISKNGRWAMEFGGGVGVYRLNYDRFQNKYNGKLIDSHRKTVFFIDNINVSISYSFPIKRGS